MPASASVAVPASACSYSSGRIAAPDQRVVASFLPYLAVAPGLAFVAFAAVESCVAVAVAFD